MKPERLKQIAIENKEMAATRDQLAAKFPQSVTVQHAAANQAVQAREFAKGVEYAGKALELAEAKGDKKAAVEALRTRALGAWYAGDYPTAAGDAERVLKERPKDPAALAIFQSAKGRARGAPPAPEEGAAGAIAAAGTDGSFYADERVRLAAERARGRLGAIKHLEEAMRRMRMGDPQGVLAAADRAQALDPGLADAYMQRALALGILKDLSRAVAELDKAIALWTAQGKTGQLPAAYAARAGVRNGLKDHAAALEDAESALAYDPGQAAAWLQRGRAKRGLGRKAEDALADFARAAELDPQFRADYEAAQAHFARLGDEAAPAAAAPSSWQGTVDRTIVWALGLFIPLTGLVVWLSRRPRRARPATSRQRRPLGSQYDLGEPIGEGGMGTVYRGMDKLLKRPVAIKKLRAELQSNARERERFLKEAELVASLHHPHIVDIYTIIQDDDQTYLVFEFVDGRTVHDLLNESSGRRLPPAQALDLLRQCAEAVDHAHARHVIHRDLKPANVMIANGGWAKVMDFGIARQVKDSLLTTTNTIVGTPSYMAPEQAMGQVVRESDVFALGATFYEMLTGAVPYRGADELKDKLDGRLEPASAIVPALGPAIDGVLAKALAPKPESRYPSAKALYAAAQAALDGRATPVPQR